MTAFRVFVYAMAWLGLSIVIAYVLAKFMRFERVQRYTVVWLKTDNVYCAYNGTMLDLDANHIVVEGDEGPVVICKADVLEVYA